MRMLRQLSALIHRRRFEREMQEEMAFHREEAERDLIEGGVGTEAAHYAAIRDFGNSTRHQEDAVESVSFRLETTWHDLRFALRQLRKNPGFAATAILILALGIGATTAIFSAVNPILFESLPYPESHRVMTIFERGADGGQRLPSFVDYVGLTD